MPTFVVLFIAIATAVVIAGLIFVVLLCSPS
jgi:hypothetical protein